MKRPSRTTLAYLLIAAVALFAASQWLRSGDKPTELTLTEFRDEIEADNVAPDLESFVPVGYGDLYGTKSGGQRQRVAIARALVNNPSIILADEPTGNLDTKTSYDIMNLFQELHDRGNTIIMVTHEDDIAHYAHRIIRLRDGLIEWDRKNDNVSRASHQAAAAAS